MNEKIAIVAVGNAGIRILENFATLTENHTHYSLFAVDSDLRTLELIRSQKITKVESGIRWTQGVGTGGDRLKAERCATETREELLTLLNSPKAIIWVGGVGGGMASGGIAALRRPFLSTNIPQIILASTPFSFEGEQRHKNAEYALKDLGSSQVLLKVSNDLLFSILPNDIPAKDAFHAADKALAQALFGLTQLFTATPLLSNGYASMKYMLEGKTAEASIGVSVALGTTPSERLQEVLTKLPSSPLIGGMRFLKEADAVIHVITAGSDLSIGEMRKALDNLKGLISSKASSVTAVNTDPIMREMVQLTVIAFKYDHTKDEDEEEANKTALSRVHAKMRTTEKGPLFSSAGPLFDQQELPIQEYSRGIFSTAFICKVDGQDLDIPTFQRFAINIDK